MAKRKRDQYRLHGFVSEIREPGLILTTTHHERGEYLMCEGKHEWIREIPTYMTNNAIFHEAGFLDKRDPPYFFVQYYEHDRGGHTDPNLTLLDEKGKTLWSRHFYAYRVWQAVTSKSELWLLHRGKKVKPPDWERIYSGYDIECIRIRDGKVMYDHRIYLPGEFQPTEKLRASVERSGFLPYRIEFAEQDGAVFLEASFSKFSRGGPLKRLFPFREILP